MNTNRPCGCKSFRTCFKCEKEIPPKTNPYDLLTTYLRSSPSCAYCPECRGIYSGWEPKFPCSAHPPPIKGPFPGIQIIPDFISSSEKESLIKGLDALPWDLSVSGRRKQNYGPRANFNKRKAKNGPFAGFPKCTEFIQRRFEGVNGLRGYHTVEQCSIEYRQDTGAWIEPHVDDCWIWGERIVQLHLLSSSVLTLNKCRRPEKYNRKDVNHYPRILSNDGESVLHNPFEGLEGSEAFTDSTTSYYDVEALRIPLPERSLLILYGDPRYNWEHSILREDIHDDRRLIIAYREFTPPYLPGGSAYEPVGKEVLSNAESFW
eukprot:TRINITY_DN4736_c0_g1_i1.p1 TRINITY_DN4736_c0_g1~~TRINITY_DN4736_c0_g1_i1.p1  ORF type:complete len:319 (+),score=48.45 TRINITY_DN4736_c0_g1_i1:467-1423(+)